MEDIIDSRSFRALFQKGTAECAILGFKYLEEHTGTLFCPECKGVLPDVERIDIRLEEDVLRKRTWLNMAWNSGFGLIREEMIDMIGWELAEKHLWLGTVWKPDGSVQPSWRTFRGKYRSRLRGKDGSRRLCSTCGGSLYFTVAKKQFLYPPPPPNIPIIDGSWGQLILSQDIFERLDLKRIKNVWIREIGVTDVSPDGLPPFEIV